MTLKSRERTALFAGSFNPFTVGHADIVRRGLGIFDKIVICVGYNINKDTVADDAQARVDNIKALYADNPRVEVRSWAGITVDLAREIGASALLRGVRSVKDFEYERDLADANRRLGGIETVILTAEAEYAWISSSLVRELKAYGKDVSALLP